MDLLPAGGCQTSTLAILPPAMAALLSGHTLCVR
jgi:hypothetical protein